VIALALLLLVAVDFSAPLRLVLALLFTFYVPGRAIVSNWPRMQRWSGVGMSIVFSLGVLTLLAALSLWAGLWHPLTLFLAESLASLAGLAFSLARRHRADDGDAAHLDAIGRYDPRQRAGSHRPAQAPTWHPAEDTRAQAPTWPRARDGQQPEVPARPRPEDRQTEALPWPAAQDRLPSFQPRPPAEGGRTGA